MMVAADKFHFLKDEPSSHEVIGGTGRKFRRGFCPKCGSPVTLNWTAVPDVQMIQVGSLDDPSQFEPQIEIWLSSGYPWHSTNPQAAKFKKGAVTILDRLDAYFAIRGRAEWWK
jgi:hypothetical protein